MAAMVGLLCLLAAVPTVLGVPITPPDTTVIPGKYIVTLRQDVAAPELESHISWVEEVHKRSVRKRDEQGVEKIWAQSFMGYSGEFDEETLEQIAGNDDVSLTPSSHETDHWC
jgi:oryzin